MSWEPSFSTGTESAEPAGLRRLLRMQGRRNLLWTAGAVLVAGYLLIPAEEPSARRPAADGEAGGAVVASSSPALAPSPVAQPGLEVYSIYLYKLPGLPPDAAPGTILDVWVTWKPPITQRPKVDLLLEDVVLQRIESGFVEGPVADLLVTRAQVADLIYGERFGVFNASVAAR